MHVLFGSPKRLEPNKEIGLDFRQVEQRRVAARKIIDISKIEGHGMVLPGVGSTLAIVIDIVKAYLQMSSF